MTVKKQEYSDLIEKKLADLSPIQTIMKMAEERNIKKMGVNPKDIISFGGGWCNHKTPNALRQKYLDIIKDEKLFHKSGRYSPIKGEYNCRKHLSEYEKQIFNIKNIEAENIILGQSATQLFHDTIRILNNKDDMIAFLDPAYSNYENSVKCAIYNAKIEFIPALNPETWQYLTEPQKALEKLKKLCSMGLKTLVISTPDNPTSQILSDDFIKNVYQVLCDNNAFLVIDYAYKELYFNKKPKYYQWSPSDYPNLITIHSSSKWLSSLGRRFGWVEANKNLINAYEKMNESSLLSPDTLHSMATSQYLKQSLEDKTLKEFIDKTRLLYKKTADVLIDSIEKNLNCKYLKPQGGLYTCIPTPNQQDSIAFVENLLKEKAVLLIPGKGFGPSMQKGLRISYGPLCHDHDKIKEGIQKVGEYINQ